MLRQENGLCLGAGPAHLPHRVDAVQRWHADVDDGDIGMQGLRVANRFLATTCFSHYPEHPMARNRCATRRPCIPISPSLTSASQRSTRSSEHTPELPS